MKLKEFKELFTYLESALYYDHYKGANWYVPIGKTYQGICASLDDMERHDIIDYDTSETIKDIMKEVFKKPYSGVWIWAIPSDASEYEQAERLIGLYLLREYMISEKLYKGLNPCQF